MLSNRAFAVISVHNDDTKDIVLKRSMWLERIQNSNMYVDAIMVDFIPYKIHSYCAHLLISAPFEEVSFASPIRN